MLQQGARGADGATGPTGPAGASDWGDIAGTLADQTDLQAALDAKVGATDAATLTNKTVQLTAAPATDLTANGMTAQLVANEIQAFGDLVYIASDGEAQLGDADAEATSRIIGMCIAAVAAGATGTYLLHGFARNDAWAWTVGGFIYLSTTGTTGNTLTQTQPSGTDDAIVIVGVATHADRIYFNPQLVIVEHA